MQDIFFLKVWATYMGLIIHGKIQCIMNLCSSHWAGPSPALSWPGSHWALRTDMQMGKRGAEKFCTSGRRSSWALWEGNGLAAPESGFLLQQDGVELPSCGWGSKLFLCFCSNTSHQNTSNSPMHESLTFMLHDFMK